MTSPVLMAQLRAMEARIAQLERERRQVFSVPVVGSTPVLLTPLTIAYGTEFLLPSGSSSGIYGLKYKTGLSTITSVPTSTVSANLAGAYDGLAWAGVWITCAPCQDVNGSVTLGTPISAPVGQVVLCWSDPITMNCAAGGTAKVYRVYSV